MRSIGRSAALLAFVATFAACAGGLVQGRTTGPEAAAATTGAPVSREAAQSMAAVVANEKEKRVMDEDEFISFDVYRRGGRYFVVAEMQGASIESATSSDAVPTEPVVESIAAAFRHLEPRIREAYAAGQRGERQENTYWERMGAKNFNQLMRSSSLVAVSRYSDQTEIWYMLHNPQINLFGGVGAEPNAKLPPDTSYEDIARAVLDIFAQHPPPPGDKPAAPKRPRKTATREQ